jgi:hypothetical protein
MPLCPPQTPYACPEANPKRNGVWECGLDSTGLASNRGLSWTWQWISVFLKSRENLIRTNSGLY